MTFSGPATVRRWIGARYGVTTSSVRLTPSIVANFNRHHPTAPYRGHTQDNVKMWEKK